MIIRIMHYCVDGTRIRSFSWTPVFLCASEMFMTEFGAELRLKSPEAILFHKHSEAVVVSDVSDCTGEELSLPVENQWQICIFAGAK